MERHEILTIEDVRKLSADEINRNWDVVSSILGGDADFAQGPPASLEDLRGRGEGYINRNWATVAQLLERAE